MSETHFIGKVTQKAIVYHDGKILLNRDMGDDHYDLPGGRIDLGEEPALGLAREMREELGIEVEVGDPIHVCQTLWGREKTQHFFIVYEALLLSTLDEIMADGVEVEEVRWATPEELESIAIYSECVLAIKKYLSKKT